VNGAPQLAGADEHDVRRRVAPLLVVATRAGLAGFGGGLSVLAMLRTSLVQRRAWLSDREFDDTATVAQMLPGGAAANALALCGLRFHGPIAAALAYTAFILPGFVATLALAVAYARSGSAVQAGALLGGLSAGVVGIVGSLTVHMVRTTVRRPWQMVVAGAALVLSVDGGASPGEVALYGIAAGLVVDLGMKRARLARARRRGVTATSPPVFLPDEGEPLQGSSVPRVEEVNGPSTLRAVVAPIFGLLVLGALGGSLASLALLFLRTGLGAYGGGFAIVPHLQATLVGGGALTQKQFSDAVAIGKVTPGPVLLLATFIGYERHGLSGAIVSTLAIFAAPLALTIGIGTWLERNRTRRVIRAALRGLTPAVVGTTGAAAVTLGSTLGGAVELGIAAAAGLTLVRFRVNPVIVLVVAGVARVLLAWKAG